MNRARTSRVRWWWATVGLFCGVLASGSVDAGGFHRHCVQRPVVGCAPRGGVGYVRACRPYVPACGWNSYYSVRACYPARACFPRAAAGGWCRPACGWGWVPGCYTGGWTGCWSGATWTWGGWDAWGAAPVVAPWGGLVGRPVDVGALRFGAARVGAERFAGDDGLEFAEGGEIPAVEPAAIVRGVARPVLTASAARTKAAREMIYPVVRESSDSARRRAASYVEAGDRMFRKGQHHSALAQYKLAATAASDWGVPYYRQTVAAAAVGRYADATAAARRAVRVDPRFVTSEFRLNDLYAERDALKQAHQDAIAAAALESPDDADLLYLIGVWLHFDGDAPRARRFFAHAIERGGEGTAESVAAFLPGAEVELAARSERL